MMSLQGLSGLRLEKALEVAKHYTYAQFLNSRDQGVKIFCVGFAVSSLWDLIRLPPDKFKQI
jgi:hypothetical protein